MKQFKIVLALAAACLGAIAARAAQSPVALGSNVNFVALAATTVTVTGGGTITGNIGINPGTAFIPGNPAVTVNGTVYAGGPVSAQAQADLTTAYNDAAGRQSPVTVAGNIGGQTLTAGLYKSTSSLAVSSGELTLDAQGDPGAVFIFQIASTFTMTSGRQIILAGGANPANIFWQVGSSATIGTTAVFHGNILAAISISVLTGATMDGRALAQSGSVTLDTGGVSKIGVPVLAAPPVILPVGTVNSTATVNDASYVSPVAAGSIAAVFGNNLSIGTSGSQLPLPLPMVLAQSSFTIGGMAAPMFFASPGQVNIQIPWELAGQTQVAIRASVGGVQSTAQTVNLATFSPGIFTVDSSGQGQGAILVAATAQLASAATPASRGGYIAIFCTGLGAVSNQPPSGTISPTLPLAMTLTTPTVSVGGTAAVVSYAGLAPGMVGLYQVNAIVPGGTVAGNAVPVVITIGGVISNTATIAVQ